MSIAGVIAALVLLGVAAALGAVLNESRPDDAGLPPFLTGDQDLPTGLAEQDELPPGLDKKLGDNTPPGLAKQEGDFTPPGLAKQEGDFTPPGLAQKGGDGLPQGLAEQGKIPPGHAKRLGVDPQPGDLDDDD